jgi:hypothetical protein
MARINWNSVERQEQEIENDENLTPREKSKLIAELHRDAREDFQEQQRDEFRDEFGY